MAMRMVRETCPMSGLVPDFPLAVGFSAPLRVASEAKVSARPTGNSLRRLISSGSGRTTYWKRALGSVADGCPRAHIPAGIV